VLSEAQTGTTVNAITIPAKTLVKQVVVVVTEVFAGGTPSLDVGDSADADGWVDTTDITETSLGTYAGDGGDAVFYLGKYYVAADFLKVVVSASLTDGTAYVLAELLALADVM